ncbi:MAG: tRNA pseudouridine(38-40) synthase TruA [Candidatus Aminicenantes bacterium]|nr:tRNA pseudouridine(38-40) synthase TruA [Candidatus Aminicenantes bacterium]
MGEINYKLTLSYDGTAFSGWQRQPGKRTVQGALEEALDRIAGKKIPVCGAGRTDAGVHARGQVANFRARLRLEKEELLRALNAILPEDVRVLSIRRAPSGFHARKMARAKVYEYRIWNSPRISPFILRYVLHWPFALDVGKMEEAARLFTRRDDFTAFSSNRLLQPVREVYRLEVKKKGPEITCTIEANGFLRYMARTITGTLIEAGRGKMEPGQVEEAFRRKDRSLAGPTAPAKGLCLVKVKY